MVPKRMDADELLRIIENVDTNYTNTRDHFLLEYELVRIYYDLSNAPGPVLVQEPYRRAVLAFNRLLIDAGKSNPKIFDKISYVSPV